MEHLLETYYIGVSNTHNKLLALSESTADTASFISLQLTINRKSMIMVRRCRQTGSLPAVRTLAIDPTSALPPAVYQCLCTP